MVLDGVAQRLRGARRREEGEYAAPAQVVAERRALDRTMRRVEDDGERLGGLPRKRRQRVEHRAEPDRIVAVRFMRKPTRSDPKAGHIDCG